MNQSYTVTQQIFSLSWLSNIAAAKLGTEEELQALAVTKVNAVLSDPVVIGLIGEWEIVWGPVVYKIFPDIQGYADNTMFVAKRSDNSGKPFYVIAVAGTNPYSWYGWFVEDFNVSNTEAWPFYQAPDPAQQPRISQGTGIGVNALTDKMMWQGQKLADFLATLTDQAIDITVTGHSLGGALSPTLALALVDNQGSGKAWNWDPDQRAVVCAMPSAGATPGDVNFSQYYDDKLATRTTRLWNSLDIVPHAWQVDMLKAIPTLYSPEIPASFLVELMVGIAIAASIAGGDYFQITPNTPPLPGHINSQQLTGQLAEMTASLDLELLDKLIARLLEKATDAGTANTDPSALQRAFKSVLQPGSGPAKPVLNEYRASKLSPGLLLKADKSLASLSEDELQLLASNFSRFLAQAGYQHVNFYIDYLGVQAFVAQMISIMGSEL